MKLIQSDFDSRPQWKHELSNAIESIHQLLHILELDPSKLNLSDAAIHQFPLRVPLSFVNRMQKGNPTDPLLLQVLPVIEEEADHPGFSTDPLEELNANPVPGLIHKYKNRVLLIGAQACAVNCRYCFRRHFPYQENRLSTHQLDRIITYIEDHTEIDEVILSGGDPLVNNDKQLQQIVSRLNNISHLERLRVHTRLPVVIPSRINNDMLHWINASRLPITFVMHINHPSEINDEFTAAVTRLKTTKSLVLNQAVLLKGINNDLDTLLLLSKKLFQAGILPYYLNVLDKVQGSQHFDVPEEDALKLIHTLMEHTSGYLVPKLVRELPEVPYKKPIK
ncbi:EF-P beta-lysylation protein EpmB [Litoribrevibacter euphylliae]|uniref:L-lysine 2,3-aminomutase n=1 Tax=Litoribrevibacter euphylliae TaxID=1834034 RepID=A0ABV7HH43_9GAMM